jgi:hypothetical protein
MYSSVVDGGEKDTTTRRNRIALIVETRVSVLNVCITLDSATNSVLKYMFHWERNSDTCALKDSIETFDRLFCLHVEESNFNQFQ